MNSSREVSLNKPIENLIASKLAKKHAEENSIHNSSIHNNSMSSHVVGSVVPSNIRIKKQKPLSMNESMLNKIVKDSGSLKKSNNLKDLKIPGPTTCSLTNSNYVNIHNLHSNTCNSGSSHSTSTLSESFQKSNSKNLLKTSNSKSKTKFAITQCSNSMTMHKKNISSSLGNLAAVSDKAIDIPSGKLVKVPSNGIETNSVINLNLQNEKFEKNEKHQNLNSNNHTLTQTSSAQSLTNSAFHSSNNYSFQNKSEMFKLNEELLQLKLSNSKLTCEINILNEKIKTLKQVITMKTSENDLIKHEYTDMVDEYKREIEKMKKLNSDLSQIKENSSKQSIYVKSTISVLIDLLELFVSPRNNLYARESSSAINRQSLQLNNSASYSIDVYDSYNNDEERRGTMVDQIQGLLIAKLNVIKKNLNLDLEREIEKVKNWTITNNKKDKDDYNLMNISNLKARLNESECSLKKSSSNDFFDLSTSNQFINQSPKFNSLELAEVKGEESKKNLYIMTTEGKENQDNQILNDSFLKDLKQNDSFDDRNGSIISTPNNQYNPFFTNDRKKDNLCEMNIIDCSIIDINMDKTQTTPKNLENRMLFNDDPTDFNNELNIKVSSGSNNLTNLNLNINLNNTFTANPEGEMSIGDINNNGNTTITNLNNFNTLSNLNTTFQVDDEVIEINTVTGSTSENIISAPIILTPDVAPRSSMK